METKLTRDNFSKTDTNCITSQQGIFGRIISKDNRQDFHKTTLFDIRNL